MAMSPAEFGALAAAAQKRYVSPSGSFRAPVAKSKRPRSFDPSGSLGGFTPAQLAAMSPQQLAQVQFGLTLRGADYSTVKPPDFDALQTAALSQAQQSAYRQAAPIQAERGYQQARQKVSAEAATNFAAAFASILQGDKTGAEGQQYALENFGGSYLGGIAARMGQELLARQQQSFDEHDFELATRLADVMDSIPGEAEKIYQSLADGAVERFKQGESIAEADYKTQISAIASLIKNKRDDQKALADATKALGGGGGSQPRIFQSGGDVFALDPVTGEVVWERRGSKPATTKVTTQVVEQPDGSKVLINKATGKKIAVVAPADPAASSSAGSSTDAKSRTKLFYDTRADVREAARALFANRGLDGSGPGADAMPGSAPSTAGSSGALPWNEAYNRLWGEYGVALVGRKFKRATVQLMIQRALRDAGFRKPVRQPTPDPRRAGW